MSAHNGADGGFAGFVAGKNGLQDTLGNAACRNGKGRCFPNHINTGNLLIFQLGACLIVGQLLCGDQLVCIVFHLVQKHQKQCICLFLADNGYGYRLEICIVNVSEGEVKHGSQKNGKHKGPEGGAEIFQLYKKIIFD